MRFGVSISDLFPVLTGVCQGCVLPPTLISAFLDWILEKMSERSSCSATFGNDKNTDLDFADVSSIKREGLIQ